MPWAELMPVRTVLDSPRPEEGGLDATLVVSIINTERVENLGVQTFLARLTVEGFTVSVAHRDWLAVWRMERTLAARLDSGATAPACGLRKMPPCIASTRSSTKRWGTI